MSNVRSRQEITARVTLSWPQGGRREGTYATLTITDAASGIQVIECDIPAEEFAAIMSGRGHVAVAAEVGPVETRTRWGKDYEIEKVALPDEMKNVYGREPSPEMVAFGAASAAVGWDGFRWSKHNYGWGLVRYRWNEKTSEATP